MEAGKVSNSNYLYSNYDSNNFEKKSFSKKQKGDCVSFSANKKPKKPQTKKERIISWATNSALWIGSTVAILPIIKAIDSAKEAGQKGMKANLKIAKAAAIPTVASAIIGGAVGALTWKPDNTNTPTQPQNQQKLPPKQ